MAFPAALNQLNQPMAPIVQNIPNGGQQISTNRYTPEQSSIMNNLAQLGSQYFNPEANEARARQQFQSQTVPGLAERFTAHGGQRSSAFQGALGQAGADLESQLAAQRQNFGAQALGFGLQPQYEHNFQPEAPASFGGLLSGLGQAAPGLLETGAKWLLGGKSGQNQLGGQAGQAAPGNAGSILGSIAGTAASALPAAGGIASALSGLGGSIGGGLAAAAPFALPVAGAAAVAGLPLLLYYLLND